MQVVRIVSQHFIKHVELITIMLLPLIPFRLVVCILPFIEIQSQLFKLLQLAQEPLVGLYTLAFPFHA